VIEKLRGLRLSRAAELVEAAVEETLTYYALPEEHAVGRKSPELPAHRTRYLRQPAIAEQSRFIGTCLSNSDRPDAADRLASHRARSWSHIHDVLGVCSCSRGNVAHRL
jgi:hypothetical protein